MRLHPVVKITVVVTALFVLAAGTFIVESYRHPPLKFGLTGGGISGRNPGEEVTVAWELQNTGWFPARITEVTIEGHEKMAPEWTVGAIGPAALMVGGIMPGVPQQYGYLLFPLGAFSVPPVRSFPKWHNATATTMTFKAPVQYGLVALYRITEPGQAIAARDFIVRYRYLGLPITLRFLSDT